MSVELWPTVLRERRALAEDLAGLTEAQWFTPSLCEGWTVRDTVAHLTAAAKVSPGAFVAKMAVAGFSAKRVQARDIRIHSGRSPADTLARFQAVIESSKHPPGPPDSWLGEVIIHAEDIRRPLGITHAYPQHAIMQVADLYKGSNLVIGAKRRIAGLRLRATDSGWTHGTGLEVAGTTRALLMAMAGRKAFLDDLEGAGVAKLRERQ